MCTVHMSSTSAAPIVRWVFSKQDQPQDKLQARSAQSFVVGKGVSLSRLTYLVAIVESFLHGSGETSGAAFAQMRVGLQ